MRGGALTSERCFRGFIDGNLDKQAKGYLGAKVYPLQNVLEENRSNGTLHEICIIIAVSTLNRTNVVKKLVSFGLLEGTDFFDFSQFVDVYLPIYAAYRFGKVYYRGTSLAPTRKCPLRCEHCLNFIPHIENPTEDDLEEVKRDLDRLFACIDCLGILNIVGGEIFLYSQYKELFRYIGERYRNQIATLSITTSAAIVPDDETFRLFAQYGFTVHVSDYRSALPEIEKNYDRFVWKLREFCVDHVLFEDHEWLDLDCFREKDMFETDKEKAEHFDACGIPWSYYKGGKILPCCWAGMAVMAGVKEGHPADYYDLRNCTTEVQENGSGKTRFQFQREKCKELMEFSAGYSELGYVSMCPKCNGYSTINRHFVPPAVQIPRKNKVGK